MSTHMQSQLEVREHLEERLRIQFPSAQRQEILHAVEVAMGQHGYVLHSHEGQHSGIHARDGEKLNQPRLQNGQTLDQSQLSSLIPQSSPSALALLRARDAAIVAAQSIPDPAVKMAAVAGAYLAHCAASVINEQQQQQEQKFSRN
ncbi:hypothetical protein [Tengunoibacter tsumagoiensis]|uniref:Uncharacterized protein n=1 Tax=Tengunoibacter tsumagoiensis TaxID=2014871 RepID=A0A401ZWZ4_9CHLR|nr:hypothetical protein [Tengunoibacter tsumagoiensis]GCE11387.1 hypothetical protein KTT_12460 [Tengunoibacter tsumagoiensis]